jgi:hypothetical protein
VQLDERVSAPAREPIEEAPQTGSFGISRQASQIVKHAVVAQRFGRIDPSQAQHPGIEESFQGLADAVAVVSLWKSDVVCEGTSQAKALKEVLDERYPGELRQADSIGRNAQISRPVVHCSKTTLLVWFSYKDQNNVPS